MRGRWMQEKSSYVLGEMHQGEFVLDSNVKQKNGCVKWLKIGTA